MTHDPTLPSQTLSQQDRLVDGLRHFGAVHAELMRQFAGANDMHATDAQALSEILFAQDAGRPLTPAALATRLARSRPAVSAVLARLMKAGYVERLPDPQDGRRVTLVAGDAVAEMIPRFFAPFAQSLSQVLAGHSSENCEALITMLHQITAGIEVEMLAVDKN